MSEEGLVERAEMPKKRSVKEFLNRYRQLGLPGAKKFRKKTRLEELTLQRDWYMEIATTAVRNQAKAHVIMAKLIDESNFALRAEDQPSSVNDILWIADDSVLNEARDYLKEFSNAKPA